MSYAEVWRDQKDRDEGRLIIAQARLRATVAKKPPSPGPVSSTGDVQSSQGADESSEVAQADDPPDPHKSSPTPSAEESQSSQRSSGSTEVAHLEDSPDPPRSSLPRGVEKSKSLQQAGEESKVLQRRGFRHPSEDEDDYDDRLERSPMIFQEKGPDDPVCMDEGLVGLYKVETNSNGDLVRVAFFYSRSSNPESPWRPAPGASFANQAQPSMQNRKRKCPADTDEDSDNTAKTICSQSTDPAEAPKNSSSTQSQIVAKPSGMTLHPGVGKDWGVRRRRMKEEPQSNREGPPEADAA